MTRILVPVDASSASEHAVRYVLATFPAAEVFLLHVEALPSGWQTHGMAEDAIASHLATVSREAIKPAHAILRDAGINHQVHHALGDAAETIVARAREWGCAGIVMGTHGHGALAGMVLGSVAYKVVHLADIPVTLVK